MNIKALSLEKALSSEFNPAGGHLPQLVGVDGEVEAGAQIKLHFMFPVPAMSLPAPTAPGQDFVSSEIDEMDLQAGMDAVTSRISNGKITNAGEWHDFIVWVSVYIDKPDQQAEAIRQAILIAAFGEDSILPPRRTA